MFFFLGGGGGLILKISNLCQVLENLKYKCGLESHNYGTTVDQSHSELGMVSLTGNKIILKLA